MHEIGIDRRTAIVARKSPRNKRIMTPVKTKADRTLDDDVLDGGFDKHRLIEDDRSLELLRDIEEMSRGFADSVDDGDRVGITALLEDRNVDGVLPVDAHDVGLELAAIDCMTNVAHEDGSVADCLERDAVDVVGRRHLAIGVDVVVLRADADVSCGQNQIGVVDRMDDIHDAELRSLQLQRIDVDHDLPVRPPIRLRD